MKQQFGCKITDKGEFKLYDPKDFKERIQFYKKMNGDRPLIMTIEPKTRKRSAAQNSYYWAGVIPAVQRGYLEAGYRYTPGEVHEELKAMFSKGEKINEETGEVKPYIKSTSELTTAEFMDYIADIQQWASEDLKTVVPDPGEQLHAEFKDQMFTPFSNGSDFVSWLSYNCELCKKSNKKAHGLSFNETKALVKKKKECGAKFAIELGVINGEVEKAPVELICGMSEGRILGRCKSFQKIGQ